jgi:voltage-gated potassium channel
MDAAGLVRSVPFFRGLDEAAIAEIAGALRRVELAADRAVVRRGEAGDCMYFIVAGEVEVKLQPATVRLGAGAFFGELALLGNAIRTATVATTKPSILLRLDVEGFRTLMAKHSDLARIIEAEGKKRLGELQTGRGPRTDGGRAPS